MSVLVVGVSHNSAPVAVLERLALDADGVEKLVADVTTQEHVGEATVLATCNRLEVYAEVDRFHGSVEALSRLLGERSGETTESLLPHLYVHYDDGAVAHLFQVAAGLDSMVLGEGQILGQTRAALRVGQELGTVGPALNTLFQQALRVGKRTRAETDIDRAAPSLVTAALERMAAAGRGAEGRGVGGSRVIILGAGAMAGLAVATVARWGAADVAVVNRTAANADRLAQEYGARGVALTDLPAELSAADILITCTGSQALLVTPPMVEAAVAGGRRLSVIDLAMPHDVDPAVAAVPGVTLLGLAELGARLKDHAPAESGAGTVSSTSSDRLGEDDPIDDVRSIVTGEVAAFLSARRKASVTPTVVALRSMATEVVEAEVSRLDARLPGLEPAVRDELVHAIRRVSDKLLHQPTVRVRELADTQGAVSYAAALAELFALDPDAVDAVTRAGGLETGSLVPHEPSSTTGEGAR